MPAGQDRDRDRDRQKATLAEARAVVHPVRLRIIRLCKDEALTNKELAGRLDMNPGTTLHHVRTLVATGFLVELPGRPGPRGITEKPYRSTDKSWHLDVAGSGREDDLERAMLEAAAAEVSAAGPGAVLESSRVSFRLRPSTRDTLHARLVQLIEDYANLDEPDGEPLAMLVLLHRR